jgi:hypothetical protein
MRILLLLLSTSLGVVGCQGDPPSSEPRLPTSDRTHRGLYSWTGDHWSPGEVIPVCWTTPGNSSEKQAIIDAVNGSWPQFGNISFNFSPGVCPTTGSSYFVRVLLTVASVPEDGGGGSASSGRTAALVAPTPDTMSRSIHIGAPWAALTTGLGRLQYLAVHEFGHTLGFDHEQDRGDNTSASDPTCNPAGSIAGPLYTHYDPESVMHYCNSGGNRSGALSSNDELGMEYTYPFGPAKLVTVSAAMFHKDGIGIIRGDDAIQLEWTKRGVPATAFYREEVGWYVDGHPSWALTVPATYLASFGPGSHEIEGYFEAFEGEGYVFPTRWSELARVEIDDGLHTALLMASASSI